MPLLIAAVVLVTVLCLLNLLLTFGVVRRLRAQGGHGHGGHDADITDLVLPVGATVPAFTAVTTAGETVSRDGLGAVLFGFFSPGCPACAERLPLFVKAAREAVGEGRRVLAVVHGDEADTREQVAALTAVARVVVEPADGPLGRGFAVAGYPVFGLLDANGTVTASGFDPKALSAPVRTAA
ncbi:redoxin domain-containing protein (plasmid) [Embleya sp. NBC_00888]|uniref:TlpA family protein disulfide reductase n=1 Tax=Embleya sp. NBC_00888 TaxID=2975960 RepID=UPI002F91AEE2|nr:redoxin domain-containing protein [Embleya sp. NBC_00888]